MKKQIIVCILMLFIFTKSSYSQCLGGNSAVSVISFANGQNITFTNPLPPNNPYSGYSGTVNSVMDGNPMPVYCIDLHRNVTLGDNTYTDTCAFVTNKIQWILNNYFPYKTSYAGKLADNNQEAAAVQAAIWRFSNLVDVSTITDATINARALSIVADANLNGTATPPVVTFSIEASGDPDAFYVKTLDQNGDPIAISNILLSITDGSISEDTVNTNASGISPDVIVSGTNTGLIFATATMLYSQGRILHSTTQTRQSLSIAYPVFGKMTVTSDWGALPVELSSFSAFSNGSEVNLNWSTASESNNSGFAIERSVSTGNQWSRVGFVSGNGNSSVTNNYSFSDRNISTGKYNYRLKQIDFNGNFEYFNLNSEIEVGSPSKFELSQNYPNPFNPSTKINYSIANEGFVSIKVFDNLGREVATLVNESKTAGFYTADFNGLNLNSGMYFYRLESNGFTKVMKMSLIK